MKSGEMLKKNMLIGLNGVYNNYVFGSQKLNCIKFLFQTMVL